MRLIDFMDTIVKKKMYNDIEIGIRDGAPVMTAIALFAYSEMIGGIFRIVNGETEDVTFGPGQSNKNFSSFLSEMGKPYSSLNSRETYRIIRGGLVHRYFIRRKSTIEINVADPKCTMDYGLNCAIKFYGDDFVYFNINQFFKDIKKTVDKLMRKIRKRKLENIEIAQHIDDTKFIVSDMMLK
ncbi:MAG: hypothetical protein ACP5UV_04440 [Thermoplasmata archaeon]